jgi:hypothetical protein
MEPSSSNQQNLAISASRTGNSSASVSSSSSPSVKVVVVTSVMLSFISFWRAAAIVLGDLGSTAYYIGGITERAIGEAAPYFIFGVMIFAFAVRLVKTQKSKTKRIQNKIQKKTQTYQK